MIFVTLGSQKFQFNRLLKEIDRLIEERKITEEVFAQIGYSDYRPKNYKYKKFLDRNEFTDKIENSKIIITHGGTGAIVGALKKNKIVIAVPRLKEFKEHVDNHQLDIINQFKEMNLIESITKIEELIEKILIVENIEFNRYRSNREVIINSIEVFIQSL